MCSLWSFLSKILPLGVRFPARTIRTGESVAMERTQRTKVGCSSDADGETRSREEHLRGDVAERGRLAKELLKRENKVRDEQAHTAHWLALAPFIVEACAVGRARQILHLTDFLSKFSTLIKGKERGVSSLFSFFLLSPDPCS